LNVLPDFPDWLHNVVQAGNEPFEDDVVDLSIPPRFKTRSFKSMKAYGLHFRVCDAESNLVTVDSGVTVTCETLQRNGISDTNCISGAVTYFGKIKEILELDYGRLKSVLLLCDWVAPISRGATACVKKDQYGFTLVKLSRLMRRSANSFVFPLQASQIFFVHCEKELQWSVVVHTNSRSTRIYEEINLAGSPSLVDRDDVYLVEYDSGCESDPDADNDIGCNQNVEDYITQEDLLVSESLAQRVDQENSEYDSFHEVSEEEE